MGELTPQERKRVEKAFRSAQEVMRDVLSSAGEYTFPAAPAGDYFARRGSDVPEVKAMTTPVTGPTIYAGWLVTGNSEGGVTRGYGLEEDFWEEPPTRFVHRLDGRIFGMPSRVPNQSFEVAGYYSPEPGYNVVVYRTMPWFGAIDVPLTVFGKAAGVTKKAIWQRVYARPVAALTPAPRGGLE